MTYRSLEYIRGRASACRIEAGLAFGGAAGTVLGCLEGPPEARTVFAIGAGALVAVGVISGLQATSFGHEVAIREAAISQATLNSSVPPQH